MTSLFSHSLLINTYRDVRGAYQVFSRGTTHTPLPTESVIDRSSANVSSPRENYSVVAKEIEKKGTEGVFTAKAKKRGMSAQEFAKKVLANTDEYDTKTVRQAAFAKGAKTVADKK